MTYKSVLFPVQPTATCEQALPFVVDFAHRLGADLTGLAARAPIFLTDPWIVSGDILQHLSDEETAQLMEAETRFRAASSVLESHAHWQTRQDYPNTAIKEAAAGADLIVATLEKGPEATTVGLPSLVLEAGVPVIALPNPAGAIKADQVLIAWRNTADARRAVSMAMPLLTLAKQVTALQVVRSEQADDALVSLRALKERLSRHGIDTEVELVIKEGEADSDALLDAAAERNAEMMVLGGYGHARAREWMLGGVTRDLLGSTTLPLFMVH